MTTSDDWHRQFKAARQAWGSQERFAQAFDIPRRTVSRWETGESRPDENYRRMLATINGDFERVVAQLGDHDHPAGRRDFDRRLAALEMIAAERVPALKTLEATVSRLTDAVEALERRVDGLERPPGRRGQRPGG